jgi:hypothetical protein
MTRLRISIKDINKVDMEALKSVEGVLGINLKWKRNNFEWRLPMLTIQKRSCFFKA